MTHSPEKPFEDAVVDWFREQYGDENVEQQRWQPDPRWYCDVVVETPYAILFIEIESRASEIRPGIAQALGYCAEEPAIGVPMVVTPVGHLDEPRVARLATSSTVVVREFDPEGGEYGRFL